MGIYRIVGWFCFLLCTASFSVSGQNLELLPIPESLMTTTGQALKIPIQIKNSGEKAQFYLIKIADADLKTGQKGYFCLNGDCLTEEITEISKRVEAASTLTGLYYVLETGLATGQSQLLFEVSVRGSTTITESPVTIMVDEKQPKNVVFKSKDIMIHEIYPNPVSSTAYIDYELYNERKAAKVVIHNILGTPMGEQELSSTENRAKILTDELSPGIYFYTVYLDNEGLITRKMVVRR